MYSAIVKVWRAFMHSLAMLIFAVLIVALTAAVLQAPVEIIAFFGVRWATRLMAYFCGGI